MSTIKADNIATLAGVSTSMANAVNGSAKAWVNFNGTGTVAIKKAYNVTSITDVATGRYYVNYTSPMPDADYSVVVSTDNAGASCTANIGNSSLTTTRFEMFVLSSTPAFIDTANNCVAVFA